MKKLQAPMALSRRRFLLAGGAAALTAGAALLSAIPGGSPTNASPGRMTVWKSPGCGCCGGWIDHVEAAGFEVDAVDTDNLDRIKAERDVPAALHSCHTAAIGGYVVEGHVPAEAIAKLLAEKPALEGIALPRMPAGSPGMNGPDEVLRVLGFRDGRVTPFWTGTA